MSPAFCVSLCNIICTTLILGILIVTGTFLLYWYLENGKVIEAFVNIGEFIIDSDDFIKDLEHTISLIKETNTITKETNLLLKNITN